MWSGKPNALISHTKYAYEYRYGLSKIISRQVRRITWLAPLHEAPKAPIPKWDGGTIL